MIVNRYGPCVGLTLWKWGRTKVELWLVPAGYVIPPHSHPSEDIELMLVKGNGTYLYRVNEETNVTDAIVCKFPRHFGRRFTIPAGFVHGFSVSARSLMFINFAKWKPGVTVTSAAIDFKLV
jgi:quercetin dioxygenase-like cupin family protein